MIIHKTIDAGVGRTRPHLLGARMLLFLGAQRVALFTGEELTAHGRDVPPLAMHDDGHVLALRFHGPILLMDDAAMYLDLEAALAASRIVEADVAVQLRTVTPGDAQGIRFGVVDGSVAIDGQVRPVCTGGFVNAGGMRASGTANNTDDRSPPTSGLRKRCCPVMSTINRTQRLGTLTETPCTRWLAGAWRSSPRAMRIRPARWSSHGMSGRHCMDGRCHAWVSCAATAAAVTCA